MADVFGPGKRSEIMRCVRSEGNRATEVRLVAVFKTCGIVGWRRHISLIGKPDFVFRRERIAVFVDGCFWHGCPLHGELPANNVEYWRAKLARNLKRDRFVNDVLRKAGWRVIRIWEHDLGRPDYVAGRIRRAFSLKRIAKMAKVRHP